jgi:membrane-bound serine protease (ClpP class)
MEAFVAIALLGVALLIAELLLPTGGVLAGLGAIGLVAAGVVALNSDASDADFIGPALITLGVLSIVCFYFITRKVMAAHRNAPVRGGGAEELVGASAEARTALDPEGQVWIEGALWKARLADGAAGARPGDRVTVEAVEGLTLVVRPPATAARPAEQGGS